MIESVSFGDFLIYSWRLRLPRKASTVGSITRLGLSFLYFELFFRAGVFVLYDHLLSSSQYFEHTSSDRALYGSPEASQVENPGFVGLGLILISSKQINRPTSMGQVKLDSCVFRFQWIG